MTSWMLTSPGDRVDVPGGGGGVGGVGGVGYHGNEATADEFLITDNREVASLRKDLTPRLADMERKARKSGIHPAATAPAAAESKSLEEAKR